MTTSRSNLYGMQPQDNTHPHKPHALVRYPSDSSAIGDYKPNVSELEIPQIIIDENKLYKEFDGNWKFWIELDQGTTGFVRGESSDSYLQRLYDFPAFHSFRDFQLRWDSLGRELALSTALYLFREGKRPLWEDHTKGGKLTLHVKAADNFLKALQLYHQLIAVLLCSSFTSPAAKQAICGVTISFRSTRTVISVWNSDAQKDVQVVESIRRTLCDVFSLSAKQFSYKKHVKSITANDKAVQREKRRKSKNKKKHARQSVPPMNKKWTKPLAPGAWRREKENAKPSEKSQRIQPPPLSKSAQSTSMKFLPIPVAKEEPLPSVLPAEQPVTSASVLADTTQSNQSSDNQLPEPTSANCVPEEPTPSIPIIPPAVVVQPDSMIFLEQPTPSPPVCVVSPTKNIFCESEAPGKEMDSLTRFLLRSLLLFVLLLPFLSVAKWVSLQ